MATSILKPPPGFELDEEFPSPPDGFELDSDPISFTPPETFQPPPMELLSESSRNIPDMQATTRGGPQLRETGPGAMADIATQFAQEPNPSWDTALRPILPSDLGPEQSLVGISPEDVPSGEAMTKATGIPEALTIPAAAGTRAVAGVGQFMTSPTGIAQTITAMIPGVGLLQRAQWLYDMAKGTGESAGNLEANIEKALASPDKVTSEEWQEIADDSANAALMLVGAGKLASHEVAKATGIRAPLGRIIESDKKRLSKDLAQELAKSELTPAASNGMALVESAAVPEPPEGYFLDQPGKVEPAVAEVAKAPDTITTLAAKKPGEVTIEEMSKLSDADASALFDAQRKAGNANQNDGVRAGLKLTSEDIPQLEKLRNEAMDKFQEHFKAGDNASYQGALGKVTWLNGAIEGAKKSGPNYSEVLSQEGRIIGESIGAKFDGEAMGMWNFTTFDKAGKPSTSFVVKAGSTPETVTAKYNLIRDNFEGSASQPRPPQPSSPNAQSKAEPSKAAGAELTPVSEGTQPAAKPVEQVAEPTSEMIGMGGATPREFQTTPQTPTGIKNATVDVERAKRGLPPVIQPARRTFGKVWDDAMAKIDQDPGYPDRLISELRDNPRALTDLEDATILHRQIDLQNEYGKATRDLAQAFDDGRLDAVQNEKARVNALSDQLLDLYNVGKKVGTETGRGLAARKMMAYEDFSLAKMELEKRAVKDGKPLTDSERAEVVRLNKIIEDTQKAYDDYVSKTEAREAERAIKDALEDAKRKRPRSGKGASIAEQITTTKDAISEKVTSGKRNDISSLAQRLARLFVERGIKEREPLIDAVHGILKEADPTFTRRETMDAISGYGEFKQLSKDQISKELRDLKGQMQQVAKLEDMQAGRPPLKTGVERRIPSPEESRLIKLVNEAKNKFQIPIYDPNTQLKSSLDTLKTRLRNRTIELRDKLARGDFEKNPKRIIQMDAEANRLHMEAAKAKFDWYTALMKDRLAKRSIPAKIFSGIGEVLNTSRAILTSLDLSAVLRQGGFIALAHPVRAAKSFPAMFRAFASEAGQHAVNQQIIARKNYPLYNQGKLFLSEHGNKLSQMEEAYMSRWADKIPLVAGSQRAYVTFLNKLRADSFDAMANSLARGKELTPVEVNAIANFVNVATGRGNLGMKENALVGLNTVFFAPRYVASRFQLLAGQPLYRGTARTRLAVAKEYGRFLAGAAVVYALAKLDGATVEQDPRSADFGKLRYGNTRLDPMAGLLQNTVLLSRLASGETKASSGKIVPIRGPKVPFGGANSADIIARFLRSKLSPAIGTGLNILTGKDVVGQPVTPGSTAQNLLVPLSMQDIYAVMIEQGVPRGTAMAILSIFGMGLQNYQPPKKK